jgi:hypothetical protein
VCSPYGQNQSIFFGQNKDKQKQIMVKQGQTKQIPAKTNYNIIDYVDSIENDYNFSDIGQCGEIMDDNIEVKNLGYKNCKDAYSDYFLRNIDFEKKYTYSKSLQDICPITTKSPKYLNCLKDLYGKFNQTNNLINSINTDVSNIVNERLQKRYASLNNIDENILNNMSDKIPINTISHEEIIADTPENMLFNAKLYYSSINSGIDSLNTTIPNITNYLETFQSQTTNTNTAQNDFLGKFKLLNGQFTLFDGCIFILDKTSIIIMKDDSKLASITLYGIIQSKMIPNSVEIGLKSLDIIVDAKEFNEFCAIREEINLSILDIATATGCGFAFPTRTILIKKLDEFS